MATRSPGIYYNEIDNTQYTNPKSVSGTTLAVVGYAKKGPINVPTEINSWKDYIDVFGEPVSGMYSGLAVKNFLSSGGTVLFNRVANKDLVAPSNYIVKNGKPAIDGYAYFKKEGDVLKGDEGYLQEKIYNFKLNVGDQEKYFLIRTPKEGRRLTQASIVDQINKQTKKTNAFFETKIEDNFRDNFYGFNIELGGEKISTNDFYLETTQEKNSKELFVENLKNALKQSNAITILDISNVPNSVGDPFTVDVENYGSQLSGTRQFKVIYNGQEKPISVNFGSEGITLETIAKELDTEINKIFGIRVFAVKGNTEEHIHNKLVFVDLNRNINSSFEIRSMEDEKSSDDLFNAQIGHEHPNFATATEEDDKHLFVAAYESRRSEVNNNFNKIDVKFDEITKDLIITNVKDAGADTTIKFVNTEYATKEPKLSLFDDSYGLFKSYFTLEGQKEINVNVEIDQNTKKIKFSNKDHMPEISKVTIPDSYFKDVNHYNILDFIEVEGIGTSEPPKPEVKAESRDKVIFTSKERGSGTNNISVEVYSTINPLNKDDIKRNLIVYVNGAPRETYENISVNYEDIEHRFDTIINAPVDNGGSAYINVLVRKECFNDPEVADIVELPDGIWNLGKPNSPNDIKKPEGTPVNAYDDYNYMVGNDGIPENDNDEYSEVVSEGSYLFQEAMDPIESPLANKDLYDFHIIIAPDDITYSVQDACIKLCETRGDAITIVDPPVGLNKKEVIDWHNGKGFGRTAPLDSNYAVTYWPWCKILDTSSGKGRFTWVMPSVIMAAQYVRVDRTVGCQIAPAGETNGMLPVIDIERYPNPTDRDDLYVNYNRVNPICKFKDGNVVAYGEKTTQRKESVLTKIHTRRMLIQIKKQCKEALRGYLFMPNTTDYLGKISNNVTAILESYKANGGLNFYKVICDETNNPAEIRQQDIINVDIVLVPQGTIEQINISLTLNKAAETVTD